MYSVNYHRAASVAEAARLLRPGGELIFFRGSVLQLLCMPDTGQVVEQLQRPQKGLYKLVWEDDDPGVELIESTAELADQRLDMLLLVEARNNDQATHIHGTYGRHCNPPLLRFSCGRACSSVICSLARVRDASRSTNP